MPQKKKLNPHKVPRTEADCRREFDRGCLFGNEFCAVIFLWVLADNYNKTPEEIREFFDRYEYYTQLIRDNYINYADIKNQLRQEFKIELDFHAGYRDRQHMPLNGMNEGRDKIV